VNSEVTCYGCKENHRALTMSIRTELPIKMVEKKSRAEKHKTLYRCISA